MIVIDKRSAGGPTRIVDAGFRGDVSESAVAVVFQKMIRTETGDVEIFEAVVVVIADGDAHAPTDIAHAGLSPNFRKLAVAVVAIEIAFRFSFRLHQIDGQRVDEVDIEIAVVVVIKKSDAAAHRFDDVFLVG